MKEVWIDIPEYEGAYQASSLGNIRSLDRTIKVQRENFKPYNIKRKGQLLKPTINRDGYEKVNLKGKSIEVHILVARSFIGERPDNQDTRHLDGDSLNNRVDNLAYGTRKQNVLDVYRNGMKWKTFDLDTANRIKRIIDTELLSIAEIARAFQVTPRTISNIRDGRTFDWKP